MLGSRYLPSKATACATAMAIATAFATPITAEPHRIDAQRSTVTIHVFKSGLFRAFGDNHVIQGTVAEGSLDDSGAPHVEVAIEARALRVLDPNLPVKDREQVQARMLGPEVLDTARFPQIRFQSTAVERRDRDHWQVHGRLELHGTSREIIVNVTRTDRRYTGRTTLRQTDFAIAPISVAGGTVKVKDEIAIEFDIVRADE